MKTMTPEVLGSQNYLQLYRSFKNLFHVLATHNLIFLSFVLAQ